MHRWLPTEDSSHALNALKRKQFFLGVIVQNMKGFEGPDSRIGQTLPFPFPNWSMGLAPAETSFSFSYHSQPGGF